MMPACHSGCCFSLHLNEDNLRFSLVFVLLIGYMLAAAAIFSAIEQPYEKKNINLFDDAMKQFIADNPTVNVTELNALIDVYATASTNGDLSGKRPRWDFFGAFFYVWTIASTIGNYVYE